MAENVTMKQLLEAGVHFGHQSRRWNPKMAKYIFTERNGIYIIDLKKTLRMLRESMKFIRESVAIGKKVLFVGTKKQARESIENAARQCGMFYVNNRWLGGMLTNFKTIRHSIMRLIELEQMWEDGTINRYTKKEISRLDRERTSLAKNLSGVKNMNEIPGILFVVDPHKETIAVAEANKLGIPIVAVVDTNCDPDPIDYVIPANDDAIRAIKLMSNQVKLACIEGLMELQAIEGVEPEGLTPEVASALGLPVPEVPAASEAKAAEISPEKAAPPPSPEPKPVAAPAQTPAPEKPAPKPAPVAKPAKTESVPAFPVAAPVAQAPSTPAPVAPIGEKPAETKAESAPSIPVPQPPPVKPEPKAETSIAAQTTEVKPETQETAPAPKEKPLEAPSPVVSEQTESKEAPSPETTQSEPGDSTDTEKSN